MTKAIILYFLFILLNSQSGFINIKYCFARNILIAWLRNVRRTKTDSGKQG